MAKTSNNAFDVLPSPSSSKPKKGLAIVNMTIAAFIITVSCLFLVDFKGWTLPLPSWLNRDQESPHPHGGGGGISDGPDNDWDAIKPSEKLRWVPCPNHSMHPNFLCARLTVPMDYNRPLNTSSSASAAPKVHIALVMLPAKGHSIHDPTSKFSTSPLILNPGGPGGSGVSFMIAAGSKVAAMVAPNRDLVSFDPRGVGLTQPLADCFLGDVDHDIDADIAGRNAALMHRYTFAIQVAEIGLANSSDKALGQFATKARAFAQLCGEKDGEDSIFRHMGTPTVARDLLSIVKAWDSWIDERAETHCATTGDAVDTVVPVAVTPEERRLDTRGKLVYWGLSYGTILGGTFASMFPDKVGRLVLDGVVNFDLYQKNEGSSFLADSDAVFDSFFKYCHRAQKQCYFYRPGQEPQDLRRRYDSIMSKLEKDPLIVTSGQARMPVIVRASDVHVTIFQSLNFPVVTFPIIALVLTFIERKLDMGGLVLQPDLNPICSAKFKMVQYPDDSKMGTLCSDMRFKWKESLPDMQHMFEELAKTSKFADYWMLTMTACNGWNINTVDPTDFNINTTMPRSDGPAINTSFPLLFVSNTLDPVTPMQNGLAMSRRFVDAGFLEQQSEGHCSISSVSLCTLRKIRAYLDQGLVPPPPKFHNGDVVDNARPTGDWDRCIGDEHPWERLSTMLAYENGDEIRIAKTWKQVHDLFSFGMSTPAHLQAPGPLRKLLDMSPDALEDIFAQLNSNAA